MDNSKTLLGKIKIIMKVESSDNSGVIDEVKIKPFINTTNRKEWKNESYKYICIQST